MSYSSAGAARQSVLATVFRASLPVLLGYGTIGLAFGLVLVGAGLPAWLSPLMALLVYAGAAQFMGVGLLAAGTALPEIALLTLLLNARHAVYGLSMLQAFSGTSWRKPYLIFALTDETYGLLTTVKVPETASAYNFYFLLSLLNQSYWFAGCTLGALLGAALPFDTAGLDFALTALFVVLLVEQVRKNPRPEPYLVAAGAAALAWIFAAAANFLLLSLLVSIVAISLLRGRLQEGGAE